MHRDPPYLIEKTAKKSGRRSSWQLDPSESVLVLTIITGNPCSVPRKFRAMADNCQKIFRNARKRSGRSYSVSGYVITSENLTMNSVSELNKAQLCRRFRQLSSKTQPPSIQRNYSFLRRQAAPSTPPTVELAVLAMFLDGLCLLGWKHARNASALDLWYRRTLDKLVLTAPLRQQAST